jgi:hypothetical protein
MPRFFTLSEAEQTLQTIRPLVEQVVGIYQEIMKDQPELWPAIQKSAGNGGNPVLSRLTKSFDRLDELLHKIRDTGVVLKDIGAGLVDFPARRGDQEVYLCWKHGESGIAFWHEIEAGFAGRQPISNF